MYTSVHIADSVLQQGTEMLATGSKDENQFVWSVLLITHSVIYLAWSRIWPAEEMSRNVWTLRLQGEPGVGPVGKASGGDGYLCAKIATASFRAIWEFQREKSKRTTFWWKFPEQIGWLMK